MTRRTLLNNQSYQRDVPLLRAAAAAGLELQPVGPRRFKLGEQSGSRGVLRWESGGWLVVERLLDAGERACDPLAEHADWCGPAKLSENGAAVLRIDLPPGSCGEPCGGASEPDAGDGASESLLTPLLARLPDWLEGRAPDDWEPPAASLLAEWITACGCEAAVDAEGSLRSVLKRKGCDGQVRIERRRGRLRCTMRIGSWSGLTDRQSEAMRRLVREVNHRTRMVRVAWLAEEETQRCEGQIDLTGFPFADESEREGGEGWPALLQGALDGLQLALCRLGVELDVLADPRNRDVVEAYLALRTD